MRCNACWRDLEGKAVSTTCGHLLCTEDAGRILSNDAACPICDQVFSKSLMRPVDVNPNDEWINMVMAGIGPQILMKSAYRSVMFYIGQKELEMQFKMNRIVAQCRQKCEAMQEKFTEKLEQVHTAYQKMAKKCQMMEQVMESLSKDKQELQEKISEKSRQKRKLDEMYDQLRCESQLKEQQFNLQTISIPELNLICLQVQLTWCIIEILSGKIGRLTLLILQDHERIYGLQWRDRIVLILVPLMSLLARLQNSQLGQLILATEEVLIVQQLGVEQDLEQRTHQ